MAIDSGKSKCVYTTGDNLFEHLTTHDEAFYLHQIFACCHLFKIASAGLRYLSGNLFSNWRLKNHSSNKADNVGSLTRLGIILLKMLHSKGREWMLIALGTKKVVVDVPNILKTGKLHWLQSPKCRKLNKPRENLIWANTTFVGMRCTGPECLKLNRATEEGGRRLREKDNKNNSF